jgi:hypothetical protein
MHPGRNYIAGGLRLYWAQASLNIRMQEKKEKEESSGQQ